MDLTDAISISCSLLSSSLLFSTFSFELSRFFRFSTGDVMLYKDSEEFGVCILLRDDDLWFRRGNGKGLTGTGFWVLTNCS
jgi:hypothetical protein